MPMSSIPVYPGNRYQYPLKAHVPPNPEPDPPPGIPPEAPDEVDLPPRETPEKIDDPDPQKKRKQS